MYKTTFIKSPARQGIASQALVVPAHSPPCHDLNIRMMHRYHRSRFDSGYGYSPLWFDCVSCPDTRFEKSNIHHIFSVRHSYRRLPRKQGEVVVSCCQHRCVALPLRSQVGHTYVALLRRCYHIPGLPELGTRRKAGGLDGLTLGRSEVTLGRSTAGCRSGSSFPLLSR